jgi:hypothetical protein
MGHDCCVLALCTGRLGTNPGDDGPHGSPNEKGRSVGEGSAGGLWRHAHPGTH